MLVKRVLDVTISVVALIALSPVLLLTACAVAVTMGRPVIFRQRRPGLHGEQFVLWKFRTMREATARDGTPLPDCDRLTRFGRVLRATSIDELPELVNVIRGEMSLVGPRPLVEKYLPYYTDRERLRHSVRPGITGWAQVCGRNHACWDARLDMDAWYVENWSLWLDVRIVWRTLAVVVRRDGVVVDPGSTMLDLDKERLMKAKAGGDDERQ